MLYSLNKNGVNFTLYLSPRSLPGEWRQWSILLEWISSEPDEIALVEKGIFTLLELESSKIHSSTSETSSLHGYGVNYSLDFFKE